MRLQWLNGTVPPRGKLQYGESKFSDMSAREFSSTLLSPINAMSHSPRKAVPKVTPPVAMDWRGRGVVGPVRDSGSCSASWAVAAVEAVEAGIAIATGGVVRRLSVQ